MTVTFRLYRFAALAALALSACGPAEKSATNAATNERNALDTVVEQNGTAPEAANTDVAVQPPAEASGQEPSPAPAPKEAAAPKPAAPPAPKQEPKPAEPAASDPDCAPEHRAAGHC